MNRLIGYLLICLLLPVVALAQQSPKMLAKPAKGFVLDKAELLNAAAVAQINSISTTSAKANDSPIYVVTIPSLASVHGFDIVTYANELFDAWGVGSRISNKGMLLLVSKADRKARIALGAGWRYAKDEECDQIMNLKIVPKFKAGDYSGGVIAGVKALSQMAKGETTPREHEGYIEIPPDVASAFYPGQGSINTIGGGEGALLCLLTPVAIFVLIAIAAASGKGNRNSNSDDSDDWFSSSRGWRSHHHNHHRHGSGMFGGSSRSTSSSSSSSRSSGGGGGFSGGGGATGSW